MVRRPVATLTEPEYCDVAKAGGPIRCPRPIAGSLNLGAGLGLRDRRASLCADRRAEESPRALIPVVDHGFGDQQVRRAPRDETRIHARGHRKLMWFRDRPCPKSAVRAVQPRLLLLWLLLRSSWLRWRAAVRSAPDCYIAEADGQPCRPGQRGLVAFQLATLAASSPGFRVLGWTRWSRAAGETARARHERERGPSRPHS